MPEVPINPVAILLAGVVNMVVGFLWYSPMMFGNVWMKLTGMTKEDTEKSKKRIPKMYLTSFIGALLMAFVLKHASVYAGSFYNMSGIQLGLMTAFWNWLGFIMPVQLTGWLFDKKPFKLFTINTGYQLVSLLTMGVILTIQP